MTTWQHRVFVNPGNDTPEIQEALDFLGQDGWELVAVESHVQPDDQSVRLYLKRPMSESE